MGLRSSNSCMVDILLEKYTMKPIVLIISNLMGFIHINKMKNRIQNNTTQPSSRKNSTVPLGTSTFIDISSLVSHSDWFNLEYEWAMILLLTHLWSSLQSSLRFLTNNWEVNTSLYTNSYTSKTMINPINVQFHSFVLFFVISVLTLTSDQEPRPA